MSDPERPRWSVVAPEDFPLLEVCEEMGEVMLRATIRKPRPAPNGDPVGEVWWTIDYPPAQEVT